MAHAWARGSGERHIALLSRHPIADWRVHNQKPITQAVLETKLHIPSPTTRKPIALSLYTAHLLPYLLLPFEARRWQALGALLKIIERERPGPHLILGDLNAIAPGDRVLQHKNPARMRRVMLLQAGLIFRLAVPRLLRAGYVDCFRACHPRRGKGGAANEADGFTWHTGNRTTRYDYILADGVLAPRLRACWVLDDHPAVEAASDHYPVVAEFDLDGL
jgi:endonuclease/exonuclease/phosphatase family metal-dependent hydrolase